MSPAQHLTDSPSIKSNVPCLLAVGRALQHATAVLLVHLIELRRLWLLPRTSSHFVTEIHYFPGSQIYKLFSHSVLEMEPRTSSMQGMCSVADPKPPSVYKDMWYLVLKQNVEE